MRRVEKVTYVVRSPTGWVKDWDGPRMKTVRRYMVISSERLKEGFDYAAAAQYIDEVKS